MLRCGRASFRMDLSIGGALTTHHPKPGLNMNGKERQPDGAKCATNDMLNTKDVPAMLGKSRSTTTPPTFL